MKSILVLLIFLSGFSASASLSSSRPSCEMLAWRWVSTLSRLSEQHAIVRQIVESGTTEELTAVLKRIPGGAPEGSLSEFAHSASFRVPGVTKENFRWLEVRTASIGWKNNGENTTDKVSVNVTEGKVEVRTKLNYADYCFYPYASMLKIEIHGRPVTLRWNTKHLNIEKYMKLIRNR